jgi:hypothetical protein
MSCQHIGTRGKSAGIACKNKANHGSFCAKHKKVERQPLQQDVVFGDPNAAAPVPREKGPKLKYSSFKFTLNSQKDFAKMTVDEKQKFKHIVEHIFTDEELPKYLIDRTNPEDASKNIVELHCEYYFEVGEAQGRLHCHGIIKLTHTGNYQMAQDRIRMMCERVLGNKIHFNVVGSADTEMMWQAYIKKAQAANKVEL